MRCHILSAARRPFESSARTNTLSSVAECAGIKSEELYAPLIGKWGSMLELARKTFSGLTSYGTPHTVPVITTVRDPIEHGLSLFSQQHGWRYFVPNQWQVQRVRTPQGRLSRVFPGGRAARCARAWMDGIFQTVSKFSILAQPTDSVPIWTNGIPRSDGGA